MQSPSKTLKLYCVTEKATALVAQNKHTFLVDLDANAIEIAKAVEAVFKVQVLKVNLMNCRGKQKRTRMSKGQAGFTSRTRKAIVTLKQGETISMI